MGVLALGLGSGATSQPAAVATTRTTTADVDRLLAASGLRVVGDGR